MIGAKIASSHSRARRKAGHRSEDPVLMGAPNVVRGGSQNGNVSARTLIEAGCCDALVSDYCYPTLSRASFYLPMKASLLRRGLGIDLDPPRPHHAAGGSRPHYRRPPR